MAFEGLNPDIEPAATNEIDFSKYEGMRSTIEGYKIITRKTDYDENRKLIPGLRREVPAMEVYSAKLGETESGAPIVAKEIIPLQVNKKTGRVEYSKHERSKATALFAAFKVNGWKELVGKPITVLTKTFGKDYKKLGFHY